MEAGTVADVGLRQRLILPCLRRASQDDEGLRIAGGCAGLTAHRAWSKSICGTGSASAGLKAGLWSQSKASQVRGGRAGEIGGGVMGSPRCMVSLSRSAPDERPLLKVLQSFLRST